MELESRSPRKTRDIVKFSGIATHTQSLEIKTSRVQKEFDVKQLRTGTSQRDYRSFHVKKLKIDAALSAVQVTVGVTGDFAGVELSAEEKTVNFAVDILQNKAGKVTSRTLQQQSTTPGKILKIAPKNWKKLEDTILDKQLRFPRKRKKHAVREPSS